MTILTACLSKVFRRTCIYSLSLPRRKDCLPLLSRRVLQHPSDSGWLLPIIIVNSSHASFSITRGCRNAMLVSKPEICHPRRDLTQWLPLSVILAFGRLGLTDDEHTGPNGTQFSRYLYMAESGNIFGESMRYDGGGSTLWISDTAGKMIKT